MLSYWQEAITFIIIGTAVSLLLRRYFFRKKPVKGAAAEACAPCSTGSCDGCSVMELKQEMEEKRQRREAGYKL